MHAKNNKLFNKNESIYQLYNHMIEELFIIKLNHYLELQF